VAYDNETPGFKKLYYPDPDKPWILEGQENLQKQDDLEILLIATDGGGLAIDLLGVGATMLFVVTNRAVQTGPLEADKARFSFGMAPTFTAVDGGSSLNVAHAPPGVRLPGFLHTFTVPDFGIPAGAVVGFDAPIPPGMPPAMAQFIIWERDSQTALYKAAESWFPVMFSGGPP
jgi:hypothetical protein